MWIDCRRADLSRGCSQQGRYAAAAAPKLGGQGFLALLGLLHRRFIVGSMDFNRVAEAISAHEIQSIIHSGPPSPLRFRKSTER